MENMVADRSCDVTDFIRTHWPSIHVTHIREVFVATFKFDCSS